MRPIRFSAFLIIAAAIPVASVAVAGQAIAAPAGWSATLREPLAQPRHDIVNSVVWTCSGAQCSAPAQDSRAQIVCRKVVQKFGPLARFASPAGEMSVEDLAKCNG